MVTSFTLSPPFSSSNLISPIKFSPAAAVTTPPPPHTSISSHPHEQQNRNLSRTTHPRRPHHNIYTTPWTPPPLMPSSNPPPKPSLKRRSSLTIPVRTSSSRNPRQQAKLLIATNIQLAKNGVRDKLSLFLPPPPQPSKPPPPAPAQAQEQRHVKNRDNFSPPHSNPPTRPLPLPPLHISKPAARKQSLRQQTRPPPLDLIHPAVRPCSTDAGDRDTESVPIKLQLPLDGLGSPPLAMEPVRHLTSLLLVRQELEAKLRGLEAILGRYGADVQARGTPPPAYRSLREPFVGCGGKEAGSVDGWGDAENEEQGMENEEGRDWGVEEEGRKVEFKGMRRRGREVLFFGGGEDGIEMEKENGDGKESTRPTYGKNLEKIFGAKPFEVASSSSSFARRLFRRSADADTNPAPCSSATVLKSESDALPPLPSVSLPPHLPPPPSDLTTLQGTYKHHITASPTAIDTSPQQQLESPSYSRTVAMLRVEYQVTALRLAETDLEVELLYLRGDIERVGRG